MGNIWIGPWIGPFFIWILIYEIFYFLHTPKSRVALSCCAVCLPISQWASEFPKKYHYQPFVLLEIDLWRNGIKNDWLELAWEKDSNWEDGCFSNLMPINDVSKASVIIMARCGRLSLAELEIRKCFNIIHGLEWRRGTVLCDVCVNCILNKLSKDHWR